MLREFQVCTFLKLYVLHFKYCYILLIMEYKAVALQ